MLKWLTISKKGLSDSLEIIQKLVSIIAIIVGAWWTYKIFIENRENYPKADIQHEVVTLNLGNGCILLRLIISIHNTGNTLLKLTEGLITIQQVLPLTPIVVEQIRQSTPAMAEQFSQEAEPFHWRVVQEKRLRWGEEENDDLGKSTLENADATDTSWPNGRQKSKFEIEPGEHDNMPVEFIMCKPPHVINITTHLPYLDEPDIARNYSSIINLQSGNTGGPNEHTPLVLHNCRR